MKILKAKGILTMGARDKTDRFEKYLVKHIFLIYWNALKNENKKPIERKKKAQCGTCIIFLPLIFYVKSI